MRPARPPGARAGGPPGGHEETRTARLTLRRPVEADVDAILAAHRDPEACRHNPSDALADRGEAEGPYRRWDDQRRRCGHGHRVVRRHGEAAPPGFCGVKPMELRGDRVLNLFHRFAPASWGRGYATEAATAATARAHRHVPGVPPVARVRPASHASRAVALRAGPVRAEHLDETGYDGPDLVYPAPPRDPTGPGGGAGDGR